jgi:hypothetical protein
MRSLRMGACKVIGVEVALVKNPEAPCLQINRTTDELCRHQQPRLCLSEVGGMKIIRAGKQEGGVVGVLC